MKVLYHPKVISDDIPALSANIKQRIKDAIEQKLMVDPLNFGFFLHGSLKGYRKLRVGAWRIIYRVMGNEVRILAIGQRKDDFVYRTAGTRT